jgi:hypothetical protein
VTLGLYFDKSGPTNEIPAVTVAGAISTADKWIALTAEWDQALHDFEELPYFHMTDYDSGRGFYEDWQARGVKRERLGRLLEIVEKYVLGTISVSVAVADLGRYGAPPVQSGMGLAAGHCMNMIPQFGYLIDHPEEDVLYVFEIGDDGFGKLETVYDHMWQEPWRREHNRLAGKLSTHEKKLPPLQVADLLAFEGWKHWAREFGGESLPERYPYLRLRESLASQWITLHPMLRLDLLKQAGVTHPVVVETASLHDFVFGPVPTAPLVLPRWG